MSFVFYPAPVRNFYFSLRPLPKVSLPILESVFLFIENFIWFADVLMCWFGNMLEKYCKFAGEFTASITQFSE